MRHKINRKKLNRTSAHRKATFSNMSISLVMNEQIKTTIAKAKSLRPYIEKLVTKARKDTVSARRDIMSSINDKIAVKKLMSVLASRYKLRPGGYTRIIRAGFRYGDRAPIAYIEFVDRDLSAKGSMNPQKNNNLLIEQKISE
jgi:large subunit ribosomal protein L17